MGARTHGCAHPGCAHLVTEIGEYLQEVPRCGASRRDQQPPAGDFF